MLTIHFVVLIFKLLKPGGLKTVAAENLAIRQQLLVANKSRYRSPPLTTLERFLFGLWTMLMSEKRIEKVFVIIKPATILKFHQALVKKKYQQLFSSKANRKSAPKGPSQEIINAALCCLFNQIISGKPLAKHLSTDNDLLFLFHRWQANLRILEIDEIKRVPNVPVSHPFVERSDVNI